MTSPTVNDLMQHRLKRSIELAREGKRLNSLSESYRPSEAEELFITAAYTLIREHNLHDQLSNSAWDLLAEEWGKQAMKLVVGFISKEVA